MRSVMAGGGRYNEHSAPQHVAGDFGLPMLAEAAQRIPLGDGAPVLIADYGASQGRNSLEPMGIAIATLRARLAPGVPISVVHTDLPDNDFSALFATLRDDPQSYLSDSADTFAYAVGRSFYEQLFPADAVAIGWTSIAVHWLSRVPVPVPEHIFSPLAAPAERAALAEQAARDWQAFLHHRARELVPGGRLVVVGSGADADGHCGAEAFLDLANSVLADLVAEGTLTPDEHARMIVPTYYRTHAEFTQPLRDAAIPGLELEASSEAVMPDPLWAAYEAHPADSPTRYAASATEFLRAFSEPSLFAPLRAERAPEDCAQLADTFYGRVAEAVAREPGAAVCRWRLVLLSIVKTG